MPLAARALTARPVRGRPNRLLTTSRAAHRLENPKNRCDPCAVADGQLPARVLTDNETRVPLCPLALCAGKPISTSGPPPTRRLTSRTSQLPACHATHACQRHPGSTQTSLLFAPLRLRTAAALLRPRPHLSAGSTQRLRATSPIAERR